MYVGFTSSSSKPIAKLNKGVEKSKPYATKPKQSKLVVVKNTSSKLKRRSHMIAPKLEFSNTQDDPIEIEEANEKGLVQREKTEFTEDESKKQDSSSSSEGGHFSSDLSKSKESHFSAGQGSIWPTLLALLPSFPPVSALPFPYSLFINFQVPYRCLSHASP